MIQLKICPTINSPFDFGLSLVDDEFNSFNVRVQMAIQQGSPLSPWRLSYSVWTYNLRLGVETERQTDSDNAVEKCMFRN